MTIEAITFDFFNTLARHRTGEGRGRALTAYMREHGFECRPWEHAVLYDVFDRHHLDYAPDAPDDEKQRYRTRLAQRVFLRLGVRAPVYVAADHADALWHILGPDSFSVYPEVPEILRVLKAAGYRLAVVSNWQCGLAHYCVELGIRDAFDYVVASAEVGCAKPDPKIFREACSLLDKPPDRVLHIGDTFAEDVEGARAAGLHAVLLCRDGDAIDREIVSIRSLTEVEEHLAMRSMG